VQIGTDKFYPNRMELSSGTPVRRCKNDGALCMYHDGTAWVSLDSYISTLICDAKAVNRTNTRFYLGSGGYDVSLTEPASQTNTMTGTNRALYIPLIPSVPDDDDDDDDDDDEDESKIDQSILDAMPESVLKPLMCPITGDILRKPVVASDGHTYEKSAIYRWLSSKNKSPLTGNPMPDQVLRSNHNIKQIISALKEDDSASDTSKTRGKDKKPSRGIKKKMRPMNRN
jgi:hypothetical protein